MATTTKNSSGGSVTIMSKSKTIQPSTINGKATADSIKKANEANARIQATEAKNRASGVKYADDPGYAPTTGTYTKSNSGGGSTTYTNGVLKGTYDNDGNFTPATSEQIATQKGVSQNESVESDSQAIARIAKYGNPFVYKGISYDKNGVSNNVPSNVAERKAYDLANPIKEEQYSKVGIIPPGYKEDTGVQKENTANGTAGQDSTSGNMLDGGLYGEQAQIGAEEANLEKNIGDRDLLNLLADTEKLVNSGIGQVVDSSNLTLQNLKVEKDLAQKENQMLKDQIQYNLEGTLDKIDETKDETKDVYLEQMAKVGGLRQSSFAVGTRKINEAFVKQYSSAVASANQELAKVGVSDAKIASYYSSKIAEIDLSVRQQKENLIDKLQSTTKTVTLGLADNQAKLAVTMKKLNSDFKIKMEALEQAKIKDERDQMKEAFDMQIKVQDLLNSTPASESIQIVLPNGETIGGQGRKKVTGGGGSGSTKDEANDIWSLIRANPDIYMEERVDEDDKSLGFQLNSAGITLLNKLEAKKKAEVLEKMPFYNDWDKTQKAQEEAHKNWWDDIPSWSDLF